MQAILSRSAPDRRFHRAQNADMMGRDGLRIENRNQARPKIGYAAIGFAPAGE